LPEEEHGDDDIVDLVLVAGWMGTWIASQDYSSWSSWHQFDLARIFTSFLCKYEAPTSRPLCIIVFTLHSLAQGWWPVIWKVWEFTRGYYRSICPKMTRVFSIWMAPPSRSSITK
jgi:hypothetical protein